MVNYTMFEYNHTQCYGDTVHLTLTKLGMEGWRLHTCEPFSIRGHEGVDSIMYSIVMERFIPESETEDKPDDTLEGMAMRG